MKLVLDLADIPRSGTSLDDDRRDLIIRLFTEVGMIMEDTSPIALSTEGNETELRDRLVQIEQSIAEIGALVAVAGVLLNEARRG